MDRLGTDVSKLSRKSLRFILLVFSRAEQDAGEGGCVYPPRDDLESWSFALRSINATLALDPKTGSQVARLPLEPLNMIGLLKGRISPSARHGLTLTSPTLNPPTRSTAANGAPLFLGFCHAQQAQASDIAHDEYSLSASAPDHNDGWPDFSPLPSLPTVELDTEAAETVHRLVKQLDSAEDKDHVRIRTGGGIHHDLTTPGVILRSAVLKPGTDLGELSFISGEASMVEDQ